MFLNKITVTESSSTKAKIKTKLERITDEPKNALVYLVKDEKYLVGAALLSEKCALTLSSDLEDYIKKKRKTDNLFVGTGKPFEEYHIKDLHNVIDVVGDFEITDLSSHYALVIVSIYIYIYTRIFTRENKRKKKNEIKNYFLLSVRSQ